MRRGTLLVVLVCAAAAPSLVAEGERAQSGLVAPGVGGIVLEHPSSWRCGVQGSPPTLRCGADGAGGFDILVTAIPGRPGKTTTDAEMEDAVRQAGSAALLTAAQKELQLRRVAGPEATGYLYAVTDREPEKGPGDFREMTQGMVTVGPLSMSVTVLTHSGDSATVDAAIAMLTTARSVATPVAPTPAEAEPPASERLAVRETADAWELTVPLSRLVMTIPKGRLTHRDNAHGGSTDSPRYFYLSDERDGLTVSGWFESDRNFEGVKELWAHDAESWKRMGLPPPQNVTFETLGRWQVVRYDETLPGARESNTHIRAHWVQAGTWIDIHVSLTTAKPPSEARAALRAMFDTIRIAEKAPAP